ncbi:response regulator transcription factor [Rheinheimera sp. D18]|uniref:response regulator n=1 Tax=Rheinheimera sp. D18 TaxID=2545632 RepID=UPI00104EE71C|nr:response regulator transcription factor [Rheinheimera sp. D18]QBL08800.1 response regulator transcription factor [Rheinheimera sp. D18]
MRILLVEDDIALAKGMITSLKHMGYQPEHCVNGKQALLALADSNFSLLILDLGLPDGFAIDVLKTLRKAGHTLPVLVLTAQDEVETKLAAFNNGADDYVVKPVDVLELEARIRVLSRRNAVRRDDLLTVADVSLDLGNLQCLHRGQHVMLTRRECMLLKDFMLQPDRILSRRQLEELCHGWDGETESNAIEVHIHSLRKKLDPQLIKTIRGVGYMLNSHYAD